MQRDPAGFRYGFWLRTWRLTATLSTWVDQLRDWSHERAEAVFDDYLATLPKQPVKQERQVLIEVVYEPSPGNRYAVTWRGEPFKLRWRAYEGELPSRVIQIPLIAADGRSVIMDISRIDDMGEPIRDRYQYRCDYPSMEEASSR